MTSKIGASFNVNGSTTNSNHLTSHIQPYFELINEVIQNALKSCQTAPGGFSSETVCNLQRIISPLQLLEKTSLSFLTSLNKDKKELNEALVKAHENLMQEAESHKIAIKELNTLCNKQLWNLQVTTQSNLSHMLSIMIENIQKVVENLKKQVSSREKEVEEVTQHKLKLQENANSLHHFIKETKLNQEQKEELLEKLQNKNTEKEEHTQALILAIRLQGDPIREEEKKIKEKKQDIQDKISKQQKIFKASHKTFLKKMNCAKSNPEQLAQRLETILTQNEVSTFVNIVQSISFDELKNALSKMPNTALNLIQRVFWYHSPYLNFDEMGLSSAIEQVDFLAELLHIICCFSPGPQAFNLIDSQELLSSPEECRCQVEDLLLLFEEHKELIQTKFNHNIAQVREGLWKITNYAQGKASWHGIEKSKDDLHPKVFSEQISTYLSFVKDWPPEDIARILNQLSSVQTDCGTGITMLLIQVLNEAWRTHMGIPTHLRSWITAACAILESTRYDVSQQLILHLANTQGEVGTHFNQRCLKMADKIRLGIRASEVANFEDKFSHKQNAFADTRLKQFKRSFTLKYNAVLIYLNLVDFLEKSILGLDAAQNFNQKDFDFYRDEVNHQAKKIYGENWQKAVFEYNEDEFPIKLRFAFKVQLLEKAGFLAQRSFLPKEKFDASSELLIGLHFFNTHMIQDAIDQSPKLQRRNPHNGDTLLHWIVKQHASVLDQLFTLATPEMKKTRNRSGQFPIHWACKHASPEGLTKVLDFYGNEELPNDSFLNLKFVLERDDKDRVPCFKILVDRIYAINFDLIKRKFNDGRTPLIHMAEMNRLDCLEAFLGFLKAKEIPTPEEFLQVNQTTNAQETALFMAASKGHLEFAEKLITLQADIEKGNNRRQTPIWTAAANGHHKIVELLIDKKANISACCEHNHTPLSIAAKEGHTSIAVTLFEEGTSLETVNHEGKSPLWLACENGKHGTVKKLIHLGADVNKTDHHELTPIFIAASKGHHEILKALLDPKNVIKGNALIPDSYGLLPLAEAAKEGHVDCVNVLTAHTPVSVDMDYGIYAGTALDIAAKHGQEACYQALLKARYSHSQFYVGIPDRDGLH